MRRFVATLLILALSLLARTAAAEHVVLVSKSPDWQVGERDAALSRACALGRFGPAQVGGYTARFTGPKGPGFLDVAKGSGLNLLDTDHHAKPWEDYFFRSAGTSSCEVFVGGRYAPNFKPTSR
jgi:hypothetical protein